MVILNKNSNLNPISLPYSHSWDQNIRKYYDSYQKYIDAQTYHLQRTQRYFLSLSFPKHYAADIIRLKVAQAKQNLGKIHFYQIQQYKQNINPDIQTHYSRTFGYSIINTGLVASFGAFGFTSYFNFSMLHRIVALALPIGLHYLANTGNARSDMITSEFLQWLTQARKATAFVQLHRQSLSANIPQLKDKNLTLLMKDYVELAQSNN